MNRRFDLELAARYKPWLQGFAPWVHWTSETYGFGKCIRSVYEYPYLLPLFIKSDHGVNLIPEFEPHEISDENLPYVTWMPEKYERGKNDDINIHLIEHPWISWRKLKKINLNNLAEGTVIFLPHGTDSIQWNYKKILNFLKKNKEQYLSTGKVSLVMHWRDILEGKHIEFLKDFNVVTVGHANSIYFPNRFYNIIRDFRNMVTFGLDTPVFYGLELGLKVKIIELAQFNYIEGFNKHKPFHLQDLYINSVDWTNYNDLLELLKKDFQDKNHPRIKEYLYLSLGVGLKASGDLKKTLYTALFHNFNMLPKIYYKDFKKIFSFKAKF
jgi:hypothetical protein